MVKSKRGKSAELVTCQHCGNKFGKEHAETRRRKNNFCSPQCALEATTTVFETKCSECEMQLLRTPSQVGETGRSFCSKSCSASYNNRLKRKSRRSKCEQKLLEMLQKEFPHVVFEANDKSMLEGYEVDIAVPSLGMAIEWNGIVHFKPIYGKHKLNRIQQIDSLKEQKAKEKNIDLIVIPDFVSNDATVQKAFGAIRQIIQDLLSN